MHQHNNFLQKLKLWSFVCLVWFEVLLPSLKLWSVKTISSPNHTFSWASLTKPFTSTVCTYFACNKQQPFLNQQEENDHRNYFMISLYKSMGLGRDQTRNPWICSQTCLLLLPLWESEIVLCFVVCYFMSILASQSSWWGRERWLLCLVCLHGVLWLLCGSSSRCHDIVCSLWLWYFLTKLTIFATNCAMRSG